VAGAAGVAAGVVAGFLLPWESAWLVAWIVAALAMVAVVWPRIVPMDAEATRRAARTEDPSRGAADVVLILAAVSSLVGAAITLTLSSSSKGTESSVLVAVAVAGIVASWAVVPTVFTLRYANLYYRAPVGGVNFHQEDNRAPTYTDFAYVAFTVAMTFQVSDTEINDSGTRATILRQSLLSYLFGAVIVAATINVVAGLFAGH